MNNIITHFFLFVTIIHQKNIFFNFYAFFCFFLLVNTIFIRYNKEEELEEYYGNKITKSYKNFQG